MPTFYMFKTPLTREPKNRANKTEEKVKKKRASVTFEFWRAPCLICVVGFISNNIASKKCQEGHDGIMNIFCNKKHPCRFQYYFAGFRWNGRTPVYHTCGHAFSEEALQLSFTAVRNRLLTFTA